MEMEEAQATYCFCGCGKRVKHPRLVVTNTNGWELNDELAEWAKLQFFASRTGLDLGGGDLADNITSGQSLWLSLRDAVHSGERADRDDEKTAVVWRKHSKKARKQLRRRFRRDQIELLDPFELPDLSAQQLTAWITNGEEPDWAAEVDPGEEPDDGQQESLASRLVDTALAAQVAYQPWEWDLTPGTAVAKTADQLSNFREDYNLVLDAIALGYWIRRAELELMEDFNTFDDKFIAQLREKFAEAEEPDTLIQVAMNDVREALPEPFAPGAKVWSEVLGAATEVLTIRGQKLLSEQPDFDEDGDISDDRREFALGLGYGLAVTVDALGIEGTRPKEGQDADTYKSLEYLERKYGQPPPPPPPPPGPPPDA